MKLWESLTLQALVTRYTCWDHNLPRHEENCTVLVSTQKYRSPAKMVMYYELRVKTEERFRQLIGAAMPLLLSELKMNEDIHFTELDAQNTMADLIL